MLSEKDKITFSMELADFIYTNEAKALVVLKAVGFDSAEIQKLFNLSVKAQEYLLTVPELKSVYDVYDIVGGDDDKTLLEKAAQIALRIKVRLLKADDTPINIRDKIATEMLERCHGKARMMIETHNLNFNVGNTMKELDRAIAAEAASRGLSPEALTAMVSGEGEEPAEALEVADGD